MDNRGKRQASSLFGGMGFYIALLVCVVAAGVVGYFALLNNNDTQTEPTQTVDRTDPGPAQSVTAPAPEPSKPVISEEPVIVTRPAPQPAADPKATAQSLVGHQVSELYAAIGRPVSSDYAPSCLDLEGEDGELVYDGFVVYTLKTAGGETIDSVA